MPRPSSRLLFIVTVLLGTASGALAADWTQGGYADRSSVPQGGTIRFSIATSVAPFTLSVVNLARPSQVLTTITGLTAPPRDCTGMWETGCGWPVTTQLTIPTNWPSGYYAAKFPTSAGTRNILFIVRAATPGSTSPIVVVATTHTYVAYNQFGGKSVYDSRSTNNQRAHIVSLARPYDDNAGLARYPLWEQQFVDWMTSEGRSFEVITDEDMENPSILANYKLVVLVGHSEYWTLTARQNLEAFSARGGHVAVFSGNTMWWQARLDLQSRQFICYKSAALDPMTGVNDDVVTTNFYAWPVFNPENTILGVAFRHGHYANMVAPDIFQLKPVEQRTPYTVVDAASWVFDGTGVVHGQQIAKATGGFEVDGAVFNHTPSGAVEVDGSDGSPKNFQVLATLPSDIGYGTIGLYTNGAGGVVFNAATQSWSHGLAGDAVVAQMTRNILDRLSTGAPMPYTPRATAELSKDLFNTPAPTPQALHGWEGDLHDITLSARCSHEGPTGLELKGVAWTELQRNFSPFNEPRDAVEVRFFLNANLLQETPAWPVPLVQLMERAGQDAVVRAAVEMQILPAGKSVRFSTMLPDGSPVASTSWVVLAPGWHELRATWRSPGTISLQVDAAAPVQAFNSTTGQRVHELFLEYPGTNHNMNGSVCMDELRVLDAACPPPAITTQPQSKTIPSGSSTTLSVTASGATSYQWFAGTTPINGATRTSVTVSPASNTTYFVRVTNTCGSVDSNTATVTVCTLPSITSHPRSKTIPSGSSTTLNVTASGATSYQWFANSAPVNGATASSITVSPTSNTAYFVRVTNSCGTVDSAVATVTVGEPPRADFDGDLRSELVLRNSSNQLAMWDFSGRIVTDTANFATVSSSAWRMEGFGDFNADGRGDILYRYTGSTYVAMWLMNGRTIVAQPVVGHLPSVSWNFEAFGDFNGDGRTDALARHETTGQVAMWEFNGTTVVNSSVVYTVADLNWRIQGTGDFNGDGDDEVIWRNASTQHVAMWEFSGRTLVNGGIVGTAPGAAWEIRGIGDFDADGRADILWQNTTTLDVNVWDMSYRTIVANVFVVRVGSAAWRVDAIGDYDGDGGDEVLWFHTSTRQLAMWELSSRHALLNGAVVATVPGDYRIQPAFMPAR